MKKSYSEGGVIKMQNVDFEGAESCFRTGLESGQRTGNKQEVVDCTNGLWAIATTYVESAGRRHMDDGNYAQSKIGFSKAFQIFKTLDDKEGMIESGTRLAEAQRAAGDNVDAQHTIQLVESIRKRSL